MKTIALFLLTLATSVCVKAQTTLQLEFPLGGEIITPAQEQIISWQTDVDSVKITILLF